MLEKPIRKAEQAAKKADKAQSKIQKKTVKVKETAVDAATGKKKAKICFEEVDKKKPPTKLSHAARDAPGVMASAKLHGKIRETEQDNVGVESAHKTEEAAETGAKLVREGYRSSPAETLPQGGTGGTSAGKSQCECALSEVLAG